MRVVANPPPAPPDFPPEGVVILGLVGLFLVVSLLCVVGL